MKQETKEILIDYIHNSNYGDYNIDDLFILFSELEINKLSDIKNALNEFISFVETHIEYFRSYNASALKKALPTHISVFKKVMPSLFQTRDKVNIRTFSEIIKKISPSKRNTKVLDVGPGSFPYSTILMAKYFNNSTAIDDKFYLSDKSLASMNVSLIKKYFKENSNIDNFDFVVGRFPCSAILPIVKVCSKYNKPYFIELCECDAPYIDDDTFGIDGWKKFLPSIDPKIQVINGYAFNIDATPKQILNIINHYKMKEFFTLKNGVYIPKKSANVSFSTYDSSNSEWTKE